MTPSLGLISLLEWLVELSLSQSAIICFYCAPPPFFVFVFLCIICVKSVINLLHTVLYNCISGVPRLTLLNLINILDL